MTTEAAAPAAPRRSDAGQVRLTDRDITGLLLLAEHYAAPYDLLAAAMAAPPARTRAIVARWRTAGLAASGSFGPGPAWCWLTPAGMAATGRRYHAGPPAAGPPGAHPRRPGRPAVAPGGPRLRRGAAVVAFRAAHPRRPPDQRPAPRTSRTPRSTGRTAPAGPTPARSGPSKSS